MIIAKDCWKIFLRVIIKIESTNTPKIDKIKSKEDALKLSDEIGMKKASEQLGIRYYTISCRRRNHKKGSSHCMACKKTRRNNTTNNKKLSINTAYFEYAKDIKKLLNNGVKIWKK